MALFSNFQEPVIFKESNTARDQLAELEGLLLSETDTDTRKAMENDIAARKAGISGEEKLMYEIKNSHIPMYVLHDLYFEHAGLTAQIDYFLITTKLIFIVECKNLYGDITIDNTGSFVRNFGYKKEGIYSPVTQCKRHMELLKSMISDAQTNAISRAMVKKGFSEKYRYLVVLANPKTILNAKYAPKDIKDCVIRADQLISCIKKMNSESGLTADNEKAVEAFAKYLISKHAVCNTDYLAKYKKAVAEGGASEILLAGEKPAAQEPVKSDGTPICPKCGALMIKRTATKGSNAGSAFWGCSRFPQCRGIVNISGQN